MNQNLGLFEIKAIWPRKNIRTNYVCLESELESETEEQLRIGNTDWYQCGECKVMAIYTESLCCLDTGEVSEELFEG